MTFAEFEEKYKGFDVETASFEDELAYRQDAFDMYETEGFTDTFETPYEECSEYNGKKYEIVRRSSYENGDCDMENLPQWIIKFEDGKEINAYPEEICKLEVNMREVEERKATFEEMSKEFKITSVTREDLEMRGFDTTNITDEQMERLAQKMCDDYLEQMFWISLDIIAEDIIGIPKKK